MIEVWINKNTAGEIERFYNLTTELNSENEKVLKKIIDRKNFMNTQHL